MTKRVQIRQLPSGIRGLDQVLGGGLPEFSFNLIAGGPGCGKTTMAHQFMFANASQEKKALYFTIFGEPPVKMLRYQQQFEFFDASKIDDSIRFVHLGKEMLEGGLEKVTQRINRELEDVDARIVVVDSFRSVVRAVDAQDERTGPANVERFVQSLALTLTGYEATTFLIGEYLERETSSNPVFTVADGIIWLYQTVTRNSVVRRLQVIKVRGQESASGLHTLTLTDKGLRVFPRLQIPKESSGWSERRKSQPEIMRTGVDGLDEMLRGGIPAGYSIMVAGPSGAGKTTLATQFILEGAELGEPGMMAIFEKRPHEHLRTTPRAAELDQHIHKGKIELVYIRPFDLSVDETLEELQEAARRMRAKRVVIDSLSGFELALAPAFRDDFRESLYRMVSALSALDVTVLLTAEVIDSFTELRLSPQGTSFVTDGIILQRYVEIDASIHKVMTVIKMRARPHSKEFHQYEVTDKGIAVGRPIVGLRGILTGVARSTTASARPRKPLSNRSTKRRSR
jgi:circadian clock protein KaiC